MAVYDYRCRVCETVFSVSRPIDTPEVLPTCPQGHAEVSRVWSAVSMIGSEAGGSSCACGGACCCGG
ncbi:MAG: zinc ribbon domain-containing protein [Acidothermus sp.]|nr:zinc ribbon domain-containing protein [Acidothermus sp.]MCL6536990.1 hypothetical protein [Acidothermus sp.]